VNIVNTPGVSLELHLAEPIHPYGHLNVPVAAGATVEWVDGVMADYPHGLTWQTPASPSGLVDAQPIDTPVVLLAEADRPLDGWPALEGFVQDGRYSYTGAQARGEADLDAFAEPLVSADWETDDLNAAPGRQQMINLTGTSVLEGRAPTTLTITRVELAFPLRTQPPRRRCTGGDVKPSTFLDLVLTDES
jgi:hypothetical protein